MTARLHIAVDTTNLKGDWRGITRYVRAVFPRLSARDDVRLTMVDPGWFGYRVPRSADVVWHPANGTFFESRAPSVVTFHDAVPFRFAADNPKQRENEQGPWLRSAATGTAFLANSQFTASEVTTFLGIDAARQTVTPLAVDDAVFSPSGPRAALRDGASFVLFVGTGASVKNVDTLLAAHARAFPNDEVKLVIAGSAPPEGSRAVTLGVLSAEKLASWYRAAMLVAVPSLYEGFGLPLLEALACGRAVVASRVGALPEVGGSACGWIDDPRDVDAWSAALRQLADDEPVRRELERAAIERAALFSWNRCAARTLSVLQAAAQSR
jgi:glycosyltransferase involved in cell wall biosynthesis